MRSLLVGELGGALIFLFVLLPHTNYAETIISGDSAAMKTIHEPKKIGMFLMGQVVLNPGPDQLVFRNSFYITTIFYSLSLILIYTLACALLDPIDSMSFDICSVSRIKSEYLEVR
jgi:hypothetical protein